MCDRIQFLFFLALLPNFFVAQECTHLWMSTMEINPSSPKPLSGDSYAAYGLLGFKDRPHLRLEMHGRFPSVRFMSFESYRTKQKLGFEALFDFQMEPDAGSENPFQASVPMETSHRDYTVHVVSEGDVAPAGNVLHLSPRTRVHSIFYRAYVPNTGVTLTESDLPRIYAFDSRTQEPIACPTAVDTVYDPGIITVLLNFIKEEKVLTFKESSFWNGTNHAIPKYVSAVSRVPFGAVSVVKFRAPTFVDTRSGVGPFPDVGDVRYWSFCIQNLKESQTLGCVPDYKAVLDPNGFTTIVVGRGEQVKRAAEERGLTFLEDRRDENQEVLGFFYRNLLPKSDFALYEGDYMPAGVVCTSDEFLRGECHE